VEPPCFSITDGPSDTTVITGTGASELASGVGYYLREHCNMVIGWKRGKEENRTPPPPPPWHTVAYTHKHRSSACVHVGEGGCGPHGCTE
jgi:hypothetical protein